MKRILAITLSIVMAFSLCACGNNGKAEKHCSNCGEGILKDAAFCEYCGAKVSNENTSNNNSSSDVSKTEETSNASSATESTSEPTKTSTPPTSAHTHSYSQKVTIANCTQDGYTTYTCSCGDSYIENKIAAKGHSYTKRITNATCTKQGYTTYTCYCGNTYKDNYTKPSHNYSNYKCTKCGQMDKDNLYGFLLAWVLKNGTTTGEFISYEIPYSHNTFFTTSITYSATEDSLYLNGYTVDFEKDVSNTTLIEIPKKPTNKYIYTCGVYRASDNAQLYYCQGNFLSSTYTVDSPLACDKFVGEQNHRHELIDLARTEVTLILRDLDAFFNEYELGYTIEDMGFTSFK